MNKELFLYRGESGTPIYIHLPGVCNANCDWCDFKRKIEPTNYLNVLHDALSRLPSAMTTCYIVGGESTMSPYLEQVLNMLKALQRFKHIILRTNGNMLLNRLNLYNKYMDIITRIELSRHAVSDLINRNLFQTNDIPYCSVIREIVELCKHRNLPIAVRYKLSDGCTTKDIINFVEYAKFYKFSDVIFEKISDQSLEPHQMEKYFTNSFDVLSENYSPIDSTVLQAFDNINVRWTTEVRDITEHTDKFIFQIHIQQNGNVTLDNLGLNEAMVYINGKITRKYSRQPLDVKVDINKINIIKRTKTNFNNIITELNSWRDPKKVQKHKVYKKMRRLTKRGGFTGFQVAKKYIVLDTNDKEGCLFHVSDNK